MERLSQPTKAALLTVRVKYLKSHQQISMIFSRENAYNPLTYRSACRDDIYNVLPSLSFSKATDPYRGDTQSRNMRKKLAQVS